MDAAAARPDTARPGTARPGTARPGTARPGTARPGLTEGRTPPDRVAERAAGGWFKSSFSQGNGECVECAPLGGGKVGMRDSKRPEGVVLAFGAGEWRAFVTAMREGVIEG